mgnify:CR=1 FL=1
MEDEGCALFQGRVFGGTSTLNNMHYIRGNRKDYDEWENAGNEGWNYENVLKYFKKSEKLDDEFRIVGHDEYGGTYDELVKIHGGDDWKLHVASKIAAGKYHSRGGSMGVNHFAYDFSLSHVKKALCDAAEEVNISRTPDFNWIKQRGCGKTMAVLNEAARGNSAKVFLSRVKNRENLFVVRNAVVTKLILNGKTVQGVEVFANGKSLNVYAEKEVILSAGVVNSPRLLLLSGIGPEEELESAGIRPVHHLPGVGKNFQAHLTFFGLPFAVKKKSEAINHLEKVDAMYQFISRGEGMFGNIGLNDVVIFGNTEGKNDGEPPDVKFLHYLNRVKDYYTFNELLTSLKIKNDIRSQYSKAYSQSDVLLMCPTLLRPKSRGEIVLVDSHHDTRPKIISNYLQDNEDVQTLIRAAKLAVRLSETKPLKDLGVELIELKVGPCGSFDFKSDEYWECLIRHLTTSMYDASGTCKMGPPDDEMAVVDAELKVRGVNRLRVADSSILPDIVRGSTSVCSVMIGEKVSDSIKKTWKKFKNDEL